MLYMILSFKSTLRQRYVDIWHFFMNGVAIKPIVALQSNCRRTFQFFIDWLIIEERYTKKNSIYVAKKLSARDGKLIL